MRSANVLALAAASCLTTSAITLAPRTPNPRVIGLDMEKRAPTNVLAHDRARMLKRQSDTVSETLDNEETLYFANLTIGTPAQSLELHIDTGSSDLWVNVANSSLCSQGQDACIGGTFDPTSSTSLKIVNTLFNITYADGSTASGDYVTDTITFGGATLTDFQFATGDISSSAEGVLGIGYVGNEVQTVTDNGRTYPNLPQALKNDGLIARNAYSLWLNDLDASTGVILFGGVNSAKYTGELASLPIIRTSAGYTEFVIALTGVTANGNSVSSSSLPAAVLLDSGSTLTYLPNDIAETIYNDVSATYDSSSGAAYVPCTLANENKNIEYTFSGQTITVPYNELVLDAGTDSRGNPLTFRNGQTACIFGIAPNLGTISVLGDTFLRSAYVVYDLEANEISLAQTVFNSTSNDVQEIASGTGLVPGASSVASAVTTVAAGTGGARLGGITGTATALNAGPTGHVSGSKKMSYVAGGAAAAVAAGMMAL